MQGIIIDARSGVYLFLLVVVAIVSSPFEHITVDDVRNVF